MGPASNPRVEAIDATEPRTYLVELLIVLLLTLLASAFYSALSHFETPLTEMRDGVEVAARTGLFSEAGPLRQFAGIFFGSVPVALVLYLVVRGGEGIDSLGLGADRIGRDLALGTSLAVALVAAGSLWYFAGLHLGLQRFVITIPPPGNWWTAPVIVLSAARAALVEEVIGVAYLIKRLEQASVSGPLAVALSAALRGATHLYQGWGWAIGNTLSGLAAAYVFYRWRRTWWLIVAHFAFDVVGSLGYLLLRAGNYCIAGNCF